MIWVGIEAYTRNVVLCLTDDEAQAKAREGTYTFFSFETEEAAARFFSRLTRTEQT